MYIIEDYIKIFFPFVEDKKNNLAWRLISADQLDAVITDKWQDVGAIAKKLNDAFGLDLSFIQVSRALNKLFAAGEICKLANGRHEPTYFSSVEATEFEGAWIHLDAAYQIARSRGCTVTKNAFRKNWCFDYGRYGLEFRKEVPKPENSLLRWRDIASGI